MARRKSAAPTPLDGTVAASPGKRLGALLLDGLIMTIVLGAVTAAAWAGIIRQLLAGTKPERVDATLLPVPGLVALALSLAYIIWLWFKGQTPGYALLATRMVNRDTAGSPCGRSLIWYILAGLIGSATLGIATLVILLRPDGQGRNWYDRTAGVVVLDLRAGRDPLAKKLPEAEPAAKDVDPDEALGATITVQAPGMIRGIPMPASQTAPAPTDSPMFAPTSSVTPMPDSSATPGASTSAGAGLAATEGIITAVPWSTGGESPVATPEPTAPAAAAAAPAVTSAPSVPAPSAAPSTTPGPTVAPLQLVLRVDTGQQLVLGEGRTVLGREPEARGQWAGAVTMAVSDPELSISKSHLGVLLTAESVTLLDLGSTNGSKMLMPDGAELELDPKEAALLLEGAMIRMGERLIAVER
ncbi:RDD family [Actinomyces bovis]|uniref:RDD family n=1 Tax=Actinomyces bovis TaxID=1658 RepID=A0ABY1VMA6_9ACTO|nr:RDD family protein [Actinomyces bovis]SPT52958.1 RDD family [Actinomyces bovis]VEG55155.1 RDD family [Actinomyces israelii]